MRQNRWVWQSIVCLAVFAAVHSGMGALTIEKYERIGELVKKITEAVQENYTLAELLELWDDASATVASIPVSVREALISANQDTLYGAPIDAPGDSESRQVYASAGGRVLKSGLQDGLGLYVMVEHQDKISTYGHLSSIRVVEGERIQKGEILGSYDNDSEYDFYYSLEDKT